MNNQNKWNIELLYAAVFLGAVFVFLALLPIPLSLPIKGPNSFVIVFFCVCAIYTGVRSVRKTSLAENRTIFQVITKSLPGFLSLIIILCAVVIIGVVINIWIPKLIL